MTHHIIYVNDLTNFKTIPTYTTLKTGCPNLEYNMLKFEFHLVLWNPLNNSLFFMPWTWQERISSFDNNTSFTEHDYTKVLYLKIKKLGFKGGFVMMPLIILIMDFCLVFPETNGKFSICFACILHRFRDSMIEKLNNGHYLKIWFAFGEDYFHNDKK